MKKIGIILGTVLLAANMYGAIHIIGDSTACNYTEDRMPRMGWGQALENYVENIEINNAAQSGRSSKSFKDEGFWNNVEASMKEGDYLFIQFGHNDQKKEDAKRYTEPGSTYDQQLKYYVESAQKKGAVPVLMTSIHRRKFKDGKIVDSHKDYLGAVQKVAEELKVPFIDVAAKTEKLFNGYGEEGSKKLFMILEPGESPNYPKGSTDNTHLTEKGANEVAKLVIEGIKELNLPLVKNVK